MRLGTAIRRFGVPGFAVTLFYLIRDRAFISPRAEVDASPLFSIGRKTQVGSFVKIKASEGRVAIGARTDIACGGWIGGHASGISIGDDCLVGPNVMIVGVNYRYDRIDQTIREQGHASIGPTVIGNNVWIGAGAVVLDGASIGDGAIVAPNAVVSGTIPALAIVQGNPAKTVFIRR